MYLAATVADGCRRGNQQVYIAYTSGKSDCLNNSKSYVLLINASLRLTLLFLEGTEKLHKVTSRSVLFFFISACDIGRV